MLFQVKPIHYIMLNVDSKLKIKNSESVAVLPSGLDIDFYVSFHDNFGNQFDAVRSNILLESNQKVGRQDLNITLSVFDFCQTFSGCFKISPRIKYRKNNILRIFR